MRRCTALSRFLTVLSFTISTAFNVALVTFGFLIYWGVQ